ncbi:tetratricopeptide repeat protein [Pseudomonas chlororaphis]|uniref:tetratricopeptide repeat protein n=1 Tax=Pseudomonas chlororaphis TaxID=587753 RepID=UPI001B300C32|nr:sel1 repeat family protein [Pseudomonas chlororaphis]QTT89051.1 sel1 repeat family protein [Pseudomonas chlororaphis]
MKTRLLSTLLLLLFPSYIFAQLTFGQITAKEQGVILFNQYKAASAIPLLKLAAEAGDPEAQYYLGEALRKSNRYITIEALHAYEASALQGDIYSMIRLATADSDLCTAMKKCSKGSKSPDDWMKTARDLAKKGADEGSSESMYLMYELSGDKSWLEKSATNGFALAQFLLATKYLEGEGLFLSPSSRTEKTEHWMRASAQGGYPRGMMGLAAILIEKKDLEGFRQWNEKAANSGYVEGVFGYASYLAGEPSNYGYSLDFVKSYALLSLLLELDGGGGVRRDVEDILPNVAEKITPEQIQTAEKLAHEWKATHPPLSFFPFKLSR